MRLVREVRAGVWRHREMADLDSAPQEDANGNGSSIRAVRG
jgi:hypothetical protein